MRTLLLSLFCLLTLGAQANPVDGLLERIDHGASRKIKTELVKQDHDFFEITTKGGKPCIKGNTWVNIASGLNWYLKYYAGVQLTWNQMKATLPATLPLPKKPERRETDLKLRYDFNYCTFSYSMAFWDWARWQTEIDWMALHGVNLPLAVVGEECVWRNLLLRLGYTKDEVNQFIAGPAFLAWWEMNNLEGWGGPLPDTWYTQQEKLQKQILRRMKEWGMEPVLPGYSGMLPSNAHEKLGVNVADGGKWNGYTRPIFLQPTDSRFHEIASLYYEELTKLFGKANYYSMDPFHEGGNAQGVDLDASGKSIMRDMKAVNPKAVWVIQGWSENPREALIHNLPQGDLLILDLFAECRPKWGIASIFQNDKGYGQHQWLFCMLENFGGNVGLHGRMDQLLNNFYQTQTNPKAAHLKGIGFTMEGSENNPVMFELMSELPWRPTKFGKEEWLKGYVRARYGTDDPTLQEAWQLLGATIYNCPMGNNQQGPHESIFCGRPSANNFQASSWSKMSNYYDPDDILRAATLFASVADKYRGNNNYEYDLVDIVRQAMADQARVQYEQTMASYKSFRRKAFATNSERFLKMLLLQDKLLGTRSEFRLGRWTTQARSLGTTPQEKDLYEWNARVQITTWGNRTCADEGGLRDYAHKEWQGLLKDFYYLRWSTYFRELTKQMEAKSKPDIEKLGSGKYKGMTTDELFSLALEQDVHIDWYAIEEPWTLQHNPYSPQPEGQPVDVAKEVISFLNR
ncbi:alpha-N-acetylglucosaminidase [Hallella sp.]|uniref:alpha-N-acetylglucosaminidase n=1 Tax=Hallella sp. TaxID=2980186 RepID=UPI00307FD134